jgi:DDE superfamily endonuclease
VPTTLTARRSAWTRPVASCLGDVIPPLPVAAGRVAREDYEYERRGVCNLFLVCEPLRGWRHVTCSERRTRIDWAHCVKDLVDVCYPDAEQIVLVHGNLNTHTPASLYEAFPPAEAKRLPTGSRSTTRPSMAAG